MQSVKHLTVGSNVMGNLIIVPANGCTYRLSRDLYTVAWLVGKESACYSGKITREEIQFQMSMALKTWKCKKMQQILKRPKTAVLPRFSQKPRYRGGRG